MSKDKSHTETVLTNEQLEKVSGGLQHRKTKHLAESEEYGSGFLGELGHTVSKPRKKSLCDVDLRTWSPTSEDSNNLTS